MNHKILSIGLKALARSSFKGLSKSACLCQKIAPQEGDQLTVNSMLLISHSFIFQTFPAHLLSKKDDYTVSMIHCFKGTKGIYIETIRYYEYIWFELKWSVRSKRIF